MNRLVIISLLTILPVFLLGQAGQEPGFPFLKNFAPAEYRAHAQNFSIAGDRQEMVYFGNFAGVLQYDGETWRLIPSVNASRISSLALDSNGILYAGARGELGTLRPDKTGALQFTAIDSALQVTLSPFAEIRTLSTTRDGITFISGNTVYNISNGKSTSWTSPREILGGFHCSGKFFLQLKEEGLVVFEKGNIRSFRGSKTFMGAIEVKSILQGNDGSLLIASGTQGLFVLNNDEITEFSCQAQPVLKQNIITCGIRLSDGSYALGTTSRGILILTADGEISQVIDKRAGLRDNSIQALYASNSNILWAALNNGISMVQIPSPLTIFDEKSGLNGAVNHIIRHDNTLYISTYQGLFHYDSKQFLFIPVPGIITACWSMVAYGKSILAATSQGIFEIENNKARLIKEGFALSIINSSADPTSVFVGEMRGFFSLKKTGGKWVIRRFEGPEEEINDLQEDGKGTIWGSTLTKGIFRYTPGTEAPVFFGRANGLPEDLGLSLNPIKGKMSVSTRKGVFIFSDSTNSFKPIKLYEGNDTTEAQWFSIITPTPQGNFWVNDGEETHTRMLIHEQGQYRPLEKPFLPITDYVIWAIYPENNGVTWLGGPDGLIRYNPMVVNSYMEPKSTLVRKIQIQTDSTIFAGSHMPGQPVFQDRKIEVRYKYNSLRFEFSAPFYAPRGENQYQFYLEGFEDTWSDWTTQSHKEYTNLPGGQYVFHVRAKNVYGNLTPETTVPFRILRPWFNTVWAYIFYLLLASAVIYLIVIIRNRQLLKEKRVLEQRIAERTAEVVQQKEEIVHQSEELANKNDELEKINAAIKSINAEINFENLLQTLLEKLRVIRSVEKATALVFDKENNFYRFKASYGWDIGILSQTTFTLTEAENRYLKNSEEVFEDIFLKTDFSSFTQLTGLEDYAVSKSMLILVIRVENRVEAFLILQNMTRENAFEAKDLSFIRNSKEHIVSAFIRTRILEDLQLTLQNLKSTQDQLVQSEKLASLGQLTAGIAHEIQNPLNFVNNFSSLSADLADEVLEVLEKIKDRIDPNDFADAEEVIGMIRGNVKKINEHGKRAESIVKGMLQHSRGKTGEFEQIEINNMVAEYVNLAYHGMRAKDKSFNTSIKTQLDPAVGKAAIIPQDLSRVILNIVNNACYALDEKTKKQIPGFSPEVVISTKKIGDKIEIKIRDNGTGIPKHVLEKIFNPFFTTKPTGKGTGLGLSMSFDIVNQVHKGKLEVRSEEGEFAEFVITIPEKQS